MENSNAAAAFLVAGLEFMGRGVNIFEAGYLAQPTLGRVLDLTEGDIDSIPVRQTNAEEIFGSNFAEFIQDFSVQAGMEGSYKGFTASVESKFAKSTRSRLDTKFAQLSLISSGSILDVKSTDKLKDILNPDFKKALAEADPKDLFERYGTHVAIKVTIGGMITYYSYSKATEHLTDTQFEIAAKAKYEGYGAEVGANSALSDKQKEEAKTVDGSTSLNVNGGTPEARVAVENGNKDSYKGWAATLADNPGFLGFRPRGLHPIWKLTNDAARSAAIELAFRQEAARQFQIRFFMATGAVAPHPTAQVRIPDQYKLLAGGAKDNFKGAGNLLRASFPDGEDGWIARGKDHVEHDPASISAFAIGIYDELDLWEVLQVDQGEGRFVSPSAEVTLPEDFVANGGVMVGGGAEILDLPGADQMLTSCYPKNATTWATNATDPQGGSNPTVITAFARGLRCKVEGVKVEVKTSQVQSTRKAHPSEKCSPQRGFTLVGGGAFVDYGTGPGNLLISSYPELPDGEPTWVWAASSKDHIKHSAATITVYAVGLKVS